MKIQQNDGSDANSQSRKSGQAYQQLPYTEAHNEGAGKGSNKKKKLMIGGGVVLVVVAIALVVYFATKGGDGGDGPTPGPDPGPSPGPTPTPNGFNPYYSEEASETTTVDTQEGVLLFNSSFPTLEEFKAKKGFKDDQAFAGIDSHNVANSRGVNNNYIERVRYAFGQSSYKRTVLSLTDDSDSTRFDIPNDLVSKQSGQYQFRLDMVDFKYKKDPFSFSFASTRTGEMLIDTYEQTFVYQKKFIQIDMKIPSGHIYGFGEREANFELGPGAWTMWPQDAKAEFDSGYGGKQLAGMHPFCLIKSNSSDEFFGIFFRSANAQAPIIQYQDNQHILSYITTGGNLDINFFFRGSAKDIIAEYQNFIGLPKLPPFWAMGWHVAGNGWGSLDKVKDVVAAYKTNNVPLESVWLDGNYMEDFSVFSVNSKFNDLKVYTEELHENDMKVVVQLYGGLAYDSEKPSKYVVAANDALIMTNESQIFEAQTQSNKTVFLDWFQQKAADVWAEGLFDLYEQYVPFDGIWLDLNTPTIFCEGGRPMCVNDLQKDSRRHLVGDDQNTTWYTSYDSSYMQENSTYYLPFIPQIYNLDNQTISLNATHNGTKNYTQMNITYNEYDVHSLFGHMQAKATYEILHNETYNGRNNSLADSRKLITSTSTFAGTGQYAQHHMAEMTRTWEHMKYSIAQLMNFNMFGIPFTGADVCGNRKASDDQTEDEQYEICARWYQLSTFYPLARTNRNSGSGSGIQIEPFNLPAKDSYNLMATNSITDRYSFARFIYGCLFDASDSGRTCFDPLLFHYPTLEKAYENIESTFMVGDSIKVSPVLESFAGKNATTFKSFFPPGKWVDMDTFEVLDVTDEEGEMVDLQASLKVKKHLKPGSIVPIQYNTSSGGQQTFANSTEQLATLGMNLIINRDDQGYAEGKLFIDEGKNISELSDKTYEYYTFKLVNKTLQKLTLNTDYIASGRQNLASVVIADAENLKDTQNMAACLITRSGIKATDLPNPVYDENNKTLTIKVQEIAEVDPINIYQMQAIVLRDPNEQYSLCDVQSAGWHVDTQSYDPSDLEMARANINLVSDKYPELNMTMKLVLGGADSRLVNIKIVPDVLLGTIFEVPEDIVNVQGAVEECDDADCSLSTYVKVNLSPSPEFLISVVNGEQETPVNVWQLNSFIQDDFLNLIDTQVFSGTNEQYHGVMGLAERTSNDVFLPTGVYSLWTRDAANPIEGGELPASNLYGVHPFYMAPATDGTWYGVYTNLAHAQDWWVTNDNTTGITNLTTIATGGIADITVVFGADPNEVTQEYHKIVGTPVLTPMWALGWHQCKWGYKNTQELMDVKQSYESMNLPLDTIWSDIDYMDAYKDFTFDEKNYKDLPQFVKDIHSENYQYIPIVDAGIAQREGQNYSVYESGKEKDVFIKAYEGGPDFTGEVWPVDAVFPNFFKTETNDWWKQNLDSFQEMLNFDGLWQDMNEASNFCNGVCYKNQLAAAPQKHKIPYTPTGRELETKSMPLDAYHETSGVDKNVTELEAHSLFGTMQVKASHEWFQANDKRTMIIERSSFAGLGKFGSRWLGDNFSEYKYMGYSVTGIMMHNVIGIPLAGSDICGFIGNTNAELCTRWYQVGAFYPFSRNHNNLNQVPQEPYQWFNYTMQGEHYTDMIRNAMQIKLALVPYYYTEMSMLHMDGGAFYKPMFFDYPNDSNAYLNQTHNVLLGSSMKASFQSTENATVTETHYYFPDGIWCSVFNKSAGCIEGPQTVELPSRIYQSFAHIKGGSIVPLQADVVGKHSTVRKVHDIQQRPTELHIHVKITGHDCNASGSFLNDDGKILNTLGKQNVYSLEFSSPCGVDSRNDGIMLNITQDELATDLIPRNASMNDFLGKIVIYNADSETFKMKGSYNLTVNYVDTTKQPVTLDTPAIFNELYNQTIYEGWKQGSDKGLYDIPLFDVDSITFTPAA